MLGLLLLTAALATAQSVISESLERELRSLSLLERTTVIVTYDQEEPLSSAQRLLLAGTGITTGITFESLPIAAVLATRSQVNRIAQLPGVRSVWANERLEYFHDTSTKQIGVDRLREDTNLRVNGVPVSGRGVTVVVNDSGIDATHPDLQFGTHVVENVQGLTNLNALSGLLPVTYLSGQPNTDTNSGHGTHCAGTIGATGAASGGLYEGVAPGAHLVGYGSGGVLFILDALGGLDYSITHQFSFEHPIRVISNSWGSTAAFNPDHPIVQSTYHAYKRGINVVFAAGNSGSGEDTHNPYAQAPWVISVGAGDKQGRLANFSSRGLRGASTTFTMPDGTTWTAVNEVTITAPGVDIISARAATNLTANGLPGETDVIAPAHLPYYTMISGTSMATPHVAGVIALLLEANPSLQPDEVRDLLRETATNMPGREPWEAGTGYLNAYAAVARAFGDTRYDGSTVNAFRTFNANANISVGGEMPFSIFFSPVGDTEEVSFEVGEDVAVVSASARITENTVAIVLHDPDGERYGSAISLPLLGENVAVSAPGKPGTWRISVSGIGSVSGVPTDPLGLTNGTSAPGQVNGTIKFLTFDGFTGIDDVAGHPAEGFIQAAVSNRLVDAAHHRRFQPDQAIRRQHVAEYLVMGAAARQSFPTDGSTSIVDASGLTASFAEAVTARGAALKNAAQNQGGVMFAPGGAFDPKGRISRAEVAYSLVQSLGLEEFAPAYASALSVDAFDQRVPLADADDVPEDLRGYVQLALELRLMNARFEVEQGPYDMTPTLVAYFEPNREVLRGEFAVHMVRLLETYDGSVDLAPNGSGGDTQSQLALAGPDGEVAMIAPGEISLAANYPNPVQHTTTIAFTLPETQHVRLTVYDVAGRRVAELANGTFEPGVHELDWAPNGLASGVYLYRLEAGAFVEARRMTVIH